MSTYCLFRKGHPGPLALITHDRQVRRTYGNRPEAIEHLLDNPSEAALRDCYVTAEVIEHPTPWTPLAVFLDRRQPKKGEVDVRLEERPVKKPRQVKLRLPKTTHPGRAQSRVPGGQQGSRLPT